MTIVEGLLTFAKRSKTKPMKKLSRRRCFYSDTL